MMSNGYGQYCPLSLASELLCQRWTMLVISRVISGCTRFNEIQRGLPQMSPSLLSRRLDELVEYGVLATRPTANGKWREYSVTRVGAELAPLIAGMAEWGQRWARDMTVEDLDPAFLVWSMHTRLNREVLPPGRTVIGFSFSGAPADSARFWLVVEDGEAEMCLKDPGHDVDLHVSSDLRVFVEAWRGFRDFRNEIRSGRIRLVGHPDLRAQFPGWLCLHVLAEVPRQRAGRERRLSRVRSTRGGASPRPP